MKVMVKPLKLTECAKGARIRYPAPCTTTTCCDDFERFRKSVFVSFLVFFGPPQAEFLGDFSQ